MVVVSGSFPRRLACALALLVYLAVGVIGCGSDSGPATPAGPLPPEAVQANKNMEDFAKSQQKK